MRLKYPKVVEELQLSEYHKAYEGQSIDVWVNPLPSDTTHVYKIFTADATKEDREKGLEQVAVIWSQGEDKERHTTREEIEAMIEESAQSDPMLLMWMLVQTMTMISDYRTTLKKN